MQCRGQNAGRHFELSPSKTLFSCKPIVRCVETQRQPMQLYLLFLESGFCFCVGSSKSLCTLMRGLYLFAKRKKIPLP